ncbi:MAG: T9SS type A sorting domain-containing protein [Candidatus Marinimicrobia bacterium]|nr:T9SS type A sorting domain-containing protein [Candidatus Neomarinimicrobiota bacterium]
MKKLIILLSLTFIFAQDTTITIWQNSGVLTIDSQDPTIDWQYPNGSEQFSTNETINGTWSADDASFSITPIQISVSKSIGEPYTSLTENIENTGNVNLILSNEDLQFVRLKATATDIFGNNSTDYSDGYFTIGNPIIPGGVDSTLVIAQPSNITIVDSKNPTINLSTPNGGESYNSGESIPIQWTADDDQFGLSPINIQQSIGIGTPYTTISEDIENSGNYNSTLPSIDEQFVRLKITATDAFGNHTSDYSDGYFTIGNPIIPGGGDSTLVFSQISNITIVDSKNPEILLESPNGGELLPAGSETEATWSATDDTFLDTPITVLFSQAIGQSYEPLETPTENDGLESVLLPEIYTDNGRFKVTATDQFGNTSSDESDNYVQLVLGGCMDIHAVNYNENAEIEGSCFYNIELNYGNNLISFPGKPTPSNTEALLTELENQGVEVNFLLGQGLGLFNTESGWSGNLTEVDAFSGYWLNVSGETNWYFTLENGYLGECLTYDLSFGNNLISYSGIDDELTLDALKNAEYPDRFEFILGQGLGLFNTDDGWSGNLNNLKNKQGYWLNSNESTSFEWGDGCVSESISLSKSSSTNYSEFEFTQSTNQAFYLINEITIDNKQPSENDYILAYNNDVLVGSANYAKLTVLPIMGRDISKQTEGFLEDGEIPQLKLYKYSTGLIINLNANLSGFSNLLVSEVQSATGSIKIIPEQFALNPAFPNPFNPVTTISYGLPIDTHISLNIYNIEGQKLTTLTNGLQSSGNHTINWNADNYPSGLYFIKLSSNEFTQTQKLMLVK